MTKPLLNKRKTKKSHKKLGRSQPNYIDRMIKLLNTLIKKLRYQKNLKLFFADDLQLVDDVELFERFNRLADDLVSDDEDLEKLHCLAEKFAALKLKKRADDAGLCEKIHSQTDEVLSVDKDIHKVSQPQVNEDCLWSETSYISLNVDEDEYDEFFKAFQRSAKKIAVPKPLEETQSLEDFPMQHNSENDSISNPSSKIICIDMLDDAHDIVSKTLEESQAKPEEITTDNFDIVQAEKLQIVPQPLEKTPEKTVIVLKQLDEKIDKIKLVYKPAEETQENLQIVPEPAEKKKEKLDIVPNSLKKQITKLQIVPKALEKTPDQLINPKPLQNKVETIKTYCKTSENLQNVSQSAENKPQNLQTLEKAPKKIEIISKPKPVMKNPLKFPIIQNPSEKNQKKLEIVPKLLEKNRKSGEKPKEMGTSKSAPMQQEERTQAIKDFQFSSAEKKKLGKYNINIFNPTLKPVDPRRLPSNQPNPNKRNIILDGSNVAFAHSRTAYFSSEGLCYCLQYFDSMGHDVKAVVPLFRRNAFQSSNPQLLDELYKAGMIVFTPCKNFQGQRSFSYDDRFILQLAYEWNAAVVSNDNYRDLIDESPAFKLIVETRVLGFTWCNHIFILPKDPYGRRGPTLDEILYY